MVLCIAYWMKCRGCRYCEAAGCDDHLDNSEENEVKVDPGYRLPSSQHTYGNLLPFSVAKKTVGDGNCYWRYLASSRWRQFKHQVARWYSLHRGEFTAVQQDKLDAAFKKNAWANNEVIQLVTEITEIEQVVYVRDKMGWAPTYSIVKSARQSSAASVKLAFHASHYSRVCATIAPRMMVQRVEAALHGQEPIQE